MRMRRAFLGFCDTNYRSKSGEFCCILSKFCTNIFNSREFPTGNWNCPNFREFSIALLVAPHFQRSILFSYYFHGNKIMMMIMMMMMMMMMIPCAFVSSNLKALYKSVIIIFIIMMNFFKDRIDKYWDHFTSNFHTFMHRPAVISQKVLQKAWSSKDASCCCCCFCCW